MVVHTEVTASFMEDATAHVVPAIDPIAPTIDYAEVVAAHVEVTHPR